MSDQPTTKKTVPKKPDTKKESWFMLYSVSNRMVPLKLGKGQDDLCLSPNQRIEVREEDLPKPLPKGVKIVKIKK